jgi:hypothetical protein
MVALLGWYQRVGLIGVALQGNQISDEGAQYISEALSTNQTIKTINLRVCHGWPSPSVAELWH